MKKYEFHEVAGVFPLLEGKPFDELVEDIKKNGLLESIWLHEEQIVDGRNRYRACKVAGVEPRFREWSGNGSLVSFVVSLNLKRRHLTKSQAACVAVEALPFYEAEAKERWGGDRKSEDYQVSKNGHLIEGRADAFVAKDFDVARGYVAGAKYLEKEAPEVYSDVKAGKIKLGVAVKKVKKEKQKQELATSPKQDFKNLFCGDATTYLKDLDSQVVDCTIIDPPYGIGFKSIRGAETNDFENDEKVFALELLKRTLPEVERVMKEGSHLYVFCGWQNIGEFKSIVEGSGFEVRNCLVWVKNNHTPTNYQLNYAHKHEFILFASKGRRFLNRDLSTDVLEFDNVMGKKHSAEKPLPLLKWLIENSTNKGDVVLDCFAGSGSTLVAAKELGRSWIGIEKEREFVDICNARLRGVLK